MASCGAGSDSRNAYGCSGTSGNAQCTGSGTWAVPEVLKGSIKLRPWLTLVKGMNMNDVLAYAKLLDLGRPDFIE
eukprot:81751-Pelagomonas_calceolata.AAC.1